jgi:sugar phosphate isomerase/epimerase
MRLSKMSFGSWAFAFGPFATNPYTFEETLKYASENGFGAIEINGFRPRFEGSASDCVCRLDFLRNDRCVWS